MHLPTWMHRRRTFERVAAGLRPDGRSAWNVVIFNHQLAAPNDGAHLGGQFRTGCATPCTRNASTFCMTTAREALWWGTKNEWLGLLAVPGLEVRSAVWGFVRKPLDESSREYIS
jgi:hypothetical protein